MFEIVNQNTNNFMIRSRFQIYNLYTSTSRKLILFTSGMISILTPFADTIYLPALYSVQKDLNSNYTMATLSVSAYLACVGIAQLLWGPLSDRYGRTKLLYGCLIGYEATTLACYFAATIQILIAVRALQGVIVGAAIISAQTIISDVFPNETRGSAMGAYLGPMLVGPIVAPIVGGALSEQYGWRSTFLFLAAFDLLIIIFCVFTIPETHHWHIQQNSIKQSLKLQSTSIPDIYLESRTSSSMQLVNMSEVGQPNIESKAAGSGDGNKEVEDDVIAAPTLMMPWEPLKYIFESDLAPFYCVVCITFATVLISFTILAIYLSQEPYNMHDLVLGLAYLPVGVAIVIGSNIGGKISDVSYKKYIKSTYGRMLLPLGLSFFNCLGCIGFGLTLQYHVQVAGPLLTQSVLGFGQAALMSSITSYVSDARPDNSAAAGSIILFLGFFFSAVGISLSVPIANIIGVDNLYYILASLSFLSTLWATVVCIKDLCNDNK